MDIFVKQDEMPKSCTGWVAGYGGCIFALENPNNLTDECLISDEGFDVTCCDDGRHPNCPLKTIESEFGKREIYNS